MESDVLFLLFGERGGFKSSEFLSYILSIQLSLFKSLIKIIIILNYIQKINSKLISKLHFQSLLENFNSTLFQQRFVTLMTR